MKVTLEPVDAVTVTALVDNFTDAFLQDQGPAKRSPLGELSVPHRPASILEGGEVIDALQAEHGFSALVTIPKGSTQHILLFDAGKSIDGVIENMRRLSLSPKDIEAIVLSHGHYDHTTGMDGLIRSLGRASLPVLIPPEFWTKRRIVLPGREPNEIPSTSKSALEDVGFQVIEEKQPSFLLDGSLLVTGEVDRTTEFEQGFPGHQAWRNGEWQPDPLILDDQALIMDVRDKGLVVLTGCGHSGIVNTLRYGRKLTGVETIYAVIGGFHLTGPVFEPIIPTVVETLREFASQYIVPAHCTGWRATHALAAAFPEASIQNSVGTRYEL